MRFIFSIGFGIVLGAASALLHNAYPPLGLLLSLLGSGVGIWLLGRHWGLRRYKVMAGVAWFVIVLKAGTLGVGHELLVEGNSTGNALIIAGSLSILISIALKN